MNTRTRQNPRYFNDDFDTSFPDEEWNLHLTDLISLNNEEMHSFYQEMIRQEQLELNNDELLNGLHPLAFASKLENDTPKFHEAMNGIYADRFYEAMEEEMNILEDIDPWEVVPRIPMC